MKSSKRKSLETLFAELRTLTTGSPATDEANSYLTMMEKKMKREAIEEEAKAKRLRELVAKTRANLPALPAYKRYD